MAAAEDKNRGIGKDVAVYVCLLVLAGIQFVIAYQDISASQTVSYTHLDVYKRQELNGNRQQSGAKCPGCNDGYRPMRLGDAVNLFAVALLIERHNPCLLYTSRCV